MRSLITTCGNLAIPRRAMSKISNVGSLALKYEIRIVPTGTVSDWQKVIDVYYIKGGRQITAPTDLTNAEKIGTLADILAKPYAAKVVC